MSNAEVGCRQLYRIAVKLRDKCCQVCGTSRKLECHHISLVSAGNWVIQFDTDYAVTLCDDHHRGAENAPHVSPERFTESMLPLLLSTMNTARAAKIWFTSRHAQPLPAGKADFKSIRLKLTALIRELEDDYYCDADIDQVDVRRRETKKVRR